MTAPTLSRLSSSHVKKEISDGEYLESHYHKHIHITLNSRKNVIGIQITQIPAAALRGPLVKAANYTCT